jgi:hypothetical protein
VRCKTSRIVDASVRPSAARGTAEAKCKASPPPRRQKAPAVGFLPRLNQRRLDPRPFCLGPISGAWILAPFASGQSTTLGFSSLLPRPNQRRLDPCPVCLRPIHGAWFLVPFASAQSAALGSVSRLPPANPRRLVSRPVCLGSIGGAWFLVPFASGQSAALGSLSLLPRPNPRRRLGGFQAIAELADDRPEDPLASEESPGGSTTSGRQPALNRP